VEADCLNIRNRLFIRYLFVFAIVITIPSVHSPATPLPLAERHTVTLAESISVSFKLTVPDTTATFSTVAMRIGKGKSIFLSLILDHGNGGWNSLSIIADNAVYIASFEKLLQHHGMEMINTLIRSSDDSFTVELADTVLTFGGIGFLEGMKYSISVLPEMSSNYDAGGNPLVVAENTEIWGDIVEKGSYTEIFLLLLLVVVDILVFVYIHFRNRARKRMKSRIKPGQVSIRNEELARPEFLRTSAVIMFGGFSIYSADGEELSKQFSPTLKELFLLLLFKQSDNGISSSKLKEILWFDKSEKSARNNRSVYITKLRQLLDNVGQHEISSATGKWMINMKEISVDYIALNQIIGKETITEKDVTDLIHIVRRGPLLPECDYQWLDEVKGRTSDSVITILSSYADHLEVRERPRLISSIADAMFVLDPVSDLALSYKCKYFNHTGKSYLAKQLYTTFIKDYKNLYDEDYNKTYSDILIEKPE
jgi:DNA-binding SARP family transcriptional activator